MLYLGANIKENRMREGLTQEQLAYNLGVSSQTISRWENGTTYPDIVMLPIIADYFHISIDMLMGYAKECTAENREQFFSDIKDLDCQRKIEMTRHMLQMYPNDIYLQFYLANSLYRQIKKKRDDIIEKEIDMLCNRIMHSNKPGIQCGAIRILAMVAARHGDIDFAMKYVNELPSIYCGREIVAEQVLNGLNFEQAIVKYLKDNS